jgi:hypothetical protein
MFGNYVGHIGFSIAAGGYFSGLYTCFFNFILSFILIRRLWKLRRDPITSGGQ